LSPDAHAAKPVGGLARAPLGGQLTRNGSDSVTIDRFQRMSTIIVWWVFNAKWFPMIENVFDVSFVAQLAQREKQIQQSYRPIIGVHKWFARRPGALFRALLLAEFVDEQPLASSYFRGQNLGSLVVGDPFMGGGTPLFEASRLGCHVVGVDINPMAYWTSV
jgi:hypothetical protein